MEEVRNLDDFEQRVNRTILRRGQEYYKDRRVDLAVFRDGVYSASVAGSDDYSVVVKLNAENDIVEAECDCPYTDGPHCKHIVAVLYAIRDRLRAVSITERPQNAKVVQLFPTAKQAENVTSAMNKEELSRILSKQSKGQLIELLTLLADSSEAVRDYLQAEYISGSKEKDKWVGLMQRHIEKAMDKDGFISYRDCHALEGACKVLERVQRAFAEGDYELGGDLALCVLHEMVELLDYADDSNGDIGDVMYEAHGLLAGIGDYLLSGSVRERCFQMALAEADDSVYDGWIEWRMNLLHVCVDLAATPDNRRSLEQCLNRIMAKIKKQQGERADSWGRDYDAEEVALVRYKVIIKFDGPKKATDFLHENISFSRFRKLAIQLAISTEEYELAENLTFEGEKQDKALPGLVQQWKEARFEVYQRAGQLKKMRTLGLELALAGDFDYYIRLKELYDSVEWIGIYPGIIESIAKHTGYVRDIYSKILIEEKEWRKLLEYVQDNPVWIIEFYRHLLKDYRVEVYKVFMRLISDEARVAANRKDYQKVCSHLRLLAKVGGEKEASELIETFMQIYKRRPAFQEELLGVKPRQPD
jgi:hypothetical protein